MSQLDPQAEERIAFLMDAGRALCDDERRQTKEIGTQAQEDLAKADERGEECRAEEARLTERRGEENAALDTDMAEYETVLYESLQDGIALGSASDELAIAGRVRSYEDRVTLRQERLNLIDFVLLPKAHEDTLTANVKAAELRHLIASVVAILHQDECSRLAEPLRLFQGGHVAVFGQRSAELRADAAELLRQWKLAENGLIEYQRSQAARQTARMAGGLSRAEIVAGAIARRKASTE
jgi:hypothetical protein